MVQTQLENAYLKHADGKMSDQEFAAVVNTAPTSLKALNLLPTAGMQSEVWSLLEDTQVTPPSVSGAKFDPHNDPFQADMATATAQCKANGTPIGVLVDSGG